MHLLSSGKNFTKCPTHVPPHVLNKWKLHFSLNMQVFLQKSFIGWRMENKVMLMIWLSCGFRFSEIRVENVQWDPTCLLDSFQHISIFRNYLTIFVVTSSCYILHNFHPKSLLGLAIMQLPESWPTLMGQEICSQKINETTNLGYIFQLFHLNKTAVQTCDEVILPSQLNNGFPGNCLFCHLFFFFNLKFYKTSIKITYNKFQVNFYFINIEFPAPL